MDPLCGLALISHHEVSDTDLHTAAKRTSPMKQELNTVAVDLAKKVFPLVGSDATGQILWRKRLSRNEVRPASPNPES
jgi:hypothetical protein